MTRHGEVGIDFNPTDTVAFGADPMSGRRSAHAGGPYHCARFDARRADLHARWVDRCHRRAETDLNPKLLQPSRGIIGKIFREARQQPRPGLDQNDTRDARIDVAKILRQCSAGEFGDSAGEFNSGRSATDDYQIHQAPAFICVRFVFGPLEGEQNSPSNLGRILDALKSGRQGLPIVVTEIGVARAGSKDEIVVGHMAPAHDRDRARRNIDADDLAQYDRNILVGANDAADRGGNVSRRQPSGRHLIEQRLKQVIVLSVNDDDLNGSIRKSFCRPQSAESGPDDDDTWWRCVRA